MPISVRCSKLPVKINLDETEQNPYQFLILCVNVTGKQSSSTIRPVWLRCIAASVPNKYFIYWFCYCCSVLHASIFLRILYFYQQWLLLIESKIINSITPHRTRAIFFSAYPMTSCSTRRYSLGISSKWKYCSCVPNIYDFISSYKSCIIWIDRCFFIVGALWCASEHVLNKIEIKHICIDQAHTLTKKIQEHSV